MKNIFVLTAFIAMFLSCTDNKEYKLTGVFAQPDYEGSTVYLFADKDKKAVLDSTIVKNNTFTFKGVASDSIQVAFVLYNNKKAPGMVVLEKGDITLAIDTAFEIQTCKVGGTPLNNDLQQYTDHFTTLMMESGKFGQEEQAAYAKGMTDSEKMDWEKKREVILSELEDYVCDYVSKNAKNVLGEQIFLRDTYFIRPEKVNKLISLFRPGFDGIDPKLKARAIAQDATSPGKKYTDVRGYDINGKEIAFSDFVGKGNVVLIDYWASWCRPCIAALPELKEFYEKNKDKGLIVIGVSLDENRDEWIKATKKYNIEWPQLSNLKGWDDPAATLYGVNGIPQTILIDKNGTIVTRFVEGSRLQSMFDDLNKNDNLFKGTDIEKQGK